MHIKKIKRIIEINITILVLVSGLNFVDFFHANAATYSTVSHTTNGSYSWTVPSDVSTAIIQAWGAGGGGATGASGGGGGGGYATSIVTLQPLGTYTISVGAGGSGGGYKTCTSGSYQAGGAGGVSTFSGPGITTVSAGGGGGGTIGGAGGTGGTGLYTGGAGGIATAATNSTGGYYGSGGGGSAGSLGNGSAGQQGTTTSAGAGGAGGAGISGSGGNSPGGGGASGATDYTGVQCGYIWEGGSAGSDGQVLVTYNTGGAFNSTSTSVSTNINPIITISNTNNINLNVTPTTTGNMSYAADLISITTNDVSGYNLTVNDNGNIDPHSNFLYNGANVICAAPSTAGSSTGWTGSLSPLGSGLYNAGCSTNTSGSWGFAVCTPGTGAPVKNLATGNYINGTTSAPANCPLTTAQSSGSQNIALSGAVNNIWSAMGGIGSIYTIQNKSGVASGDTYLINYAVALNTNQPSGNGSQGSAYSVPVIYTVTTN